MDELNELAQFVKEHPDDHNQRWRLAKKLYASWDYRGALEHLKTLKEAWPNQQNVIHYLATTYYRVGNFDAAINELRALLEVYPSDASVWRLLGRICEAADRPADAKKAYQEAMICSPSTSLAQAVERLEGVDESRSTVTELSAVGQSMMAPDKTQVTCRYCGTPNDPFLPRCIQCHESLDPEAQSKAPKAKREEDIDLLEAAPNRAPLFVLLGVFVLVVVIGGVLLWIVVAGGGTPS